MSYVISIDDTKNWEILRAKLNSYLAAIDTRLTTDEAAITTLQGQRSYTYLNSGTVTNQATLDIALTTGYNGYRISVANMEPATDGAIPWARVSINNGVSYRAGGSDYAFAGNSIDSAASAAALCSDAATSLILGKAQTSTTGYGSQLVADITTNGIANPHVHWVLDQVTQTAMKEESNYADGRVVGIGGPITNLRLMFSTGNIAQAQWVLYGVRGL